jgi:hypothetical protein
MSNTREFSQAKNCHESSRKVRIIKSRLMRKSQGKKSQAPSRQIVDVVAFANAYSEGAEGATLNLQSSIFCTRKANNKGFRSWLGHRPSVMHFCELANVQVGNAISVTARTARSATIILPWSKPRHFPNLLLSDIVARCCKT